MLTIKGIQAIADLSEEMSEISKEEKKILPFGVTISYKNGIHTLLGKPSYDKWVTIPKKPNFIQKLLAYFLVKTGRVSFVRREEEYIDYAFDINASEIFSW